MRGKPASTVWMLRYTLQNQLNCVRKTSCHQFMPDTLQMSNEFRWHCISQCCSCAPCDLRWRRRRVFLSSAPKTTGHLSQRPERVPTMESSLCPEEAHLSFCSRKRHTQLKDSILISELVLFQFIIFLIFLLKLFFMRHVYDWLE